MANWAVLGDIQFELLSCTALDGRFGMDFAEHARIGGKPRLQRVAERLDEWSLQLRFHYSTSDPAAEVARVRAALSAGEALAFVLGSGEHLGHYVITTIGESVEQSFADGLLMSADLSLELREYVQRDVRATADGAAVRKPGRTLASVRKAGAGITGSAAMRTIREGLTVVKKAAGAYRDARDVVAAARQITSNPALAIDRAMGASASLAKMAGLEGDLQALAPYASRSDVAAVMNLGTQVAAFATTAQGRLVGIDASNAAGRLGEMANDMGNVGSSMDGASAPMARLTADVVVRSPDLTN